MRIAITGASGFVGQALVPRLHAAGHSLLLVGRSADSLKQRYPGLHATDYAHLSQTLPGCDALIHLAVLNTGADASMQDYQLVNVDLWTDVLQVCVDAQIAKVVLISSLHAENPNQSAYAASKRDAEALLEAHSATDQNRKGYILRFPAVYTDRFAGQLAVLNRLPRFLQTFALQCAACIKPVIGADAVVNAVQDTLHDPSPFQRRFVSDGQRTNPVYGLLRRTVDLVGGAAGLLVLSPILLGLWAWVKATSPGPGLFAQERVGRHQRTFTCYKFRTMAVGTRNAASHEVGTASVTPQGQFLRRWKLDELPQLWNVLLGQQTLIGPRPCLPAQRALIDARETLSVFTVRPGITGWAQIHGVDMRAPERLARIDAEYIARRTLVLDLKILLATLRGAGGGDAAAES
ncbi:MAG: sugar transferase [Pseudomonadota bacterium]